MTELELALAQDANSSAFFPLVEAYLEQRRFMEAMVVCKKRIKARPEEVEARGQLAQVYVKQNKVSRALQEMDDVVAERNGSAAALAERGRIRLLSGDDKGGIEDLKKAIDLEPELETASALLQEKGIVYPEPAPEPTPPRRWCTPRLSRWQPSRAARWSREAPPWWARRARPRPCPARGAWCWIRAPGGRLLRSRAPSPVPWCRAARLR